MWFTEQVLMDVVSIVTVLNLLNFITVKDFQISSNGVKWINAFLNLYLSFF